MIENIVLHTQQTTYESVRVLVLSHVPKLNAAELLLDGGSVSNLDVSALTCRGYFAGARIIQIVRLDLHVAAEESNLNREDSPIRIGLGLLHGGGGDDAPIDDELGCTWDRPGRHVLDGGDLRVFEPQRVGRDGDLRAGTPTVLDGLGGDDETLNVALKELELNVVVVKVIFACLIAAIVFPHDAKIPAVPVGLSEFPAAVGLVEDDNIPGALWL